MENEACGFSDFDRGTMRQKMAIFKRGNSVCRGTKSFEWRNFHEFHRGAMRQKMAIFKQGNSVWRSTKKFEWRNFHELDRGTMRQKMAIFKEGNSVCRGPKFCKGRCWWKSSFYWWKIGRTLPNFEYFWIGRIWTTFSMQTCRWKLSFYEKKLVAHGHISWIWFDRGTMREKWRFSKRETIYRGVHTFCHGGDVHENHHFIEEKNHTCQNIIWW